MQRNRDYGITPHLKLGLRDYTPFEIGITGVQDLPFQGPYNIGFGYGQMSIGMETDS